MAKKATKKSREIVVSSPIEAKPVDRDNVDMLLTQAIEKGASVDVMERLFDLHQKVQASRAKTAFTVAMSELQSSLPVIKKLKNGVVAKFAPIEDILEMTKETIKKHGFTYRWNTSQKEGDITVTCIATHVLGHSEETEMTSEVEEIVTGRESGKATKSAPQRAASTITFLKRYTFVNMFGITVAGEDFDGRMEQQRGKKSDAKTPVAELEKRAISKIESTNTIDVVIKCDEYVQKDKGFSKAFKEKVHRMAMSKVTRLENEQG